MDPQIIEWAFKAIVSIILAHGVRTLSKLFDSVESLNIKMAVVVEQISNHDKRIERLEDKR